MFKKKTFFVVFEGIEGSGKTYHCKKLYRKITKLGFRPILTREPGGLKNTKDIRKILEGGKRIAFGARALIEGGIQSLPKMCMPGGLLIGCDAGTLNMPKIKGSHTAMKSGIIAAEAIVENIKNNKDLSIYEEKFKKSWAYSELYAARNVKPSFRWGLFLGIIYRC